MVRRASEVLLLLVLGVVLAVMVWVFWVALTVPSVTGS